ncbi:MAG TPA: type IV pilin protein [Gammaproteobacteria bacterium]|nr:type IV pilin protein [Gammaproteobacteria bacterium]
MLHNRIRGFTLFEMVIALSIIGMLATIAFPAYKTQQQKSRRAECQAALMQFASVMERDFSRNGNAYRNILTLTPPGFPNRCPIDGSSSTSYILGISSLSASTYQLTATPTGAQADDSCGTLTLTNLLQKGQGSGTIDQCWR